VTALFYHHHPNSDVINALVCLFVCFFHSCLLCSCPLGCSVSKKINKNWIELNYWYGCICLSILLHIFFNVRPYVMHFDWLGLHDSYVSLCSYVRRTLRTIPFVPWYLGGTSVVIEVGQNCEWTERVKPQNQRQWFTRMRIDARDSWRLCEASDFHCTWDVTRQLTAMFRRLRREQLNLSVQWVNFVQDIKACSRT
jgi:hypothetical protein